jgi:hypothetical protein
VKNLDEALKLGNFFCYTDDSYLREDIGMKFMKLPAQKQPQDLNVNIFICYIGNYQINLLQLQMVIAGCISFIDISYHNSYINYGKSDPLIIYLYELFLIPACVHMMKQPSSEERHISIGP